jgi:membrane associated rhomboid family serine protease
LSVVCKSCGSEVSPYVTECPYCGHRLRKRAPRLEREGDEIKVRESRRERRRRERRERRERRDAEPRRFGLAASELEQRPLGTISVLACCAVLLVVTRAAGLSVIDVGAIVGPVGGEVWRYVAAPFVYDDMGALIVLAGAIAIFGPPVERRIGTVATVSLIVICGSGGMLVADGAATLGAMDLLVAAGGNGVALGLIGAWLMLWQAEAKSAFTEPLDLLGVTAVAVVVLLMPLVEITADPVAGLAGGLLGLGLGRIAASRLGTVDG